MSSIDSTNSNYMQSVKSCVQSGYVITPLLITTVAVAIIGVIALTFPATFVGQQLGQWGGVIATTAGGSLGVAFMVQSLRSCGQISAQLKQLQVQNTTILQKVEQLQTLEGDSPIGSASPPAAPIQSDQRKQLIEKIEKLQTGNVSLHNLFDELQSSADQLQKENAALRQQLEGQRNTGGSRNGAPTPRSGAHSGEGHRNVHFDSDSERDSD